ncbi:MAG: hypothetical protein R3E96_09240 [Planctomycetota bacterium]
MPNLGAIAGASLGQRSVEQAKAAGGRSNSAEAAKDFEKLIATMLVKQLRQTLKNGFFPEGPGNDAYNGWFDDAMGTALTESHTLNLAGQLKAQLQSPTPEMQ